MKHVGGVFRFNAAFVTNGSVRRSSRSLQLRQRAALAGILIFLTGAHQKPVLAESQTPTTAASKPAKTPPKDNQAATTPASTKPDLPDALIRTTIRASRREVSVDGSYGFFAELENIGTVPVALYSQELVLVIQPEVTASRLCTFSVEAYLPTEPQWTQESSSQQAAVKGDPNLPPVRQVNQGTLAQDPRGTRVRIQPKEHYTVFWDVNKERTQKCWAGNHSWLETYAFVPNDYVFVIDGKAYLSPDTGEEKTYHTFTETTSIKVVIPQSYAMVAALAGAWLAYFVALFSEKGVLRTKWASDQRVTRTEGVVEVLKFLTAPLLGVAVTIVASRLADTQFPIKVSVNDVWGAMTIGFIAYFIGNKFIEKLAGLTK